MRAAKNEVQFIIHRNDYMNDEDEEKITKSIVEFHRKIACPKEYRKQVIKIIDDFKTLFSISLKRDISEIIDPEFLNS